MMYEHNSDNNKIKTNGIVKKRIAKHDNMVIAAGKELDKVRLTARSSLTSLPIVDGATLQRMAIRSTWQHNLLNSVITSMPSTPSKCPMMRDNESHDTESFHGFQHADRTTKPERCPYHTE